jgi:hypothetical protein
MRIETIRTLAGPNTYHHQPVLVMKLELDGLTDTESREISCFNERLINLLPGLREHRCSRDRRGFSRDILDEFSDDVALATPDVMRRYGYTVRPRLSRILVSIGHLIEQRYTLKPHLLLTEEQKKKQWQRVVVYPAFFIFCTVLVLIIGLKLGLPLDAKSDIASKRVLPIIAAFIKLLANAAWFILLSIAVILAVLVFYRIITAKDLDDRAALENSWEKVKDILLGDIVAAAILSLIITLLT